MELRIHHKTRYQFDGQLRYGLQQVRLYPSSNQMQTVRDWQVSVEGGDWQASFTDQHENHVSLVRVERGAQELVITCDGIIETLDKHGVYGPHTGSAPLWYFKRKTPLTQPGKYVAKLIKDLPDLVKDPVSALHALSGRITEAVAYETGTTDASTTAEAALEQGQGVCQDHAHIFVAAARKLGFPARYVSGYLMMNDRVDQDASHAWAEAWIENLGWTGFDVSNCISPDERYVRVATGLGYRQAAPVRGLTVGDFSESLQVDIQVQQ